MSLAKADVPDSTKFSKAQFNAKFAAWCKRRGLSDNQFGGGHKYIYGKRTRKSEE